jgi:uncharacterized protein
LSHVILHVSNLKRPSKTHVKLEGRMSVAIVTGASSGLGTCYVDAVTQMFPEVDELWLIARREERLRQVAAAHPNKNCVVIPMDMADMDALVKFAGLG